MFSQLFKNWFRKSHEYVYESDAVIIACFYNPTGSQYRLKAFNIWYESIKHLNHRIIELVIGDAEYELPESKYIRRMRTDSLLWHKETLLNMIIADLPAKYEYVFWLDTDVILTNKFWLQQAVSLMATGHYDVVQPYEWAFHLQKDQTEPEYKDYSGTAEEMRARMMWRSYLANYTVYGDAVHQKHAIVDRGHPGFAWGAKRELLDAVPLFEKAFIGSGDSILAYACAGDIVNEHIRKTFEDPETLREILYWQTEWFAQVQGRVTYVPGDLYHIWHGDIGKRKYYNRHREFMPLIVAGIVSKGDNGLYRSDNPAATMYMANYFNEREILPGNDDHITPPLEYGGGTFGGAGAGGDIPPSTLIPTPDELLATTSLMNPDQEWIQPEPTNYDDNNLTS